MQSSGTRNWIHWAAPLLVLLLAGLIAYLMVVTSPKAERKAKPRVARLVQVESLKSADHSVIIKAWGEVIPAKTVLIKPLVSGEIISVNPGLRPGNVIQEGEVIAEIDPIDYHLQVKQQQSQVAQIKSEIEIELGQRSIAQSEYALLNKRLEKNDERLILRKPQLESLQAKLEASQALLNQAERELARTRIVAPFTGQIVQNGLEKGMTVSQATEALTLVGTDNYWVEVSVPVAALKWVDYNNRSQLTQVKLFNAAAWGEEYSMSGEVIELLSGLEPDGRLAKLLVNVSDPLGLSKDGERDTALNSPLLLGSFVSVQLQGKVIRDVFKLDRKLLRDDDRVWVMSSQKTLDIRSVRVAYRGQDYVLVDKGLNNGELIITSNFATAVPGMALRLVEQRVQDQ